MDLDHFCFPVGVCGEVEQFRAFFTGGEVVFPVAGDSGHIEAFGVIAPAGPIEVDEVVGSPLICFFPDGDMDNILPHERFVGDTGNEELAVGAEDDDIVYIGAIADEFVFFHSHPDEAVAAVDV